MTQRFFYKTTKKKYVRPCSNSAKNNNKVIKTENVMTNEDIEKLEQLTNDLSDKKIPAKRVKVEKKEKGIIERTENSKIVLTEDNKMLLND